MAWTNKSQNLTTLLTCELDLDSRYMWLAMIRKKIQLKRSNETPNTNETRSFTNVDYSQILQYQNHVQVG